MDDGLLLFHAKTSAWILLILYTDTYKYIRITHLDTFIAILPKESGSTLSLTQKLSPSPSIANPVNYFHLCMKTRRFISVDIKYLHIDYSNRS